MLIFKSQPYFRILAFLLILTTFLPIFYNNLPPVIGSHHLFVIIWFASIILFFSKLLSQRFLIHLLLYAVILILLLNSLWDEMDIWNKGFLQSELYVFILTISVLLYFRMANDFKGLAILVKWSMIFIAITAVMSIYSSVINPLYARQMIGGLLSPEEIDFYKKLGGGSYGFASALVTLFPMMFYYYRNNDKSIFSKLQILIFGLLCFFALLRIQIFANIILAIVAIFVSFLIRSKIKKSILLLMALAVIALFVPVLIYSNLLETISSSFSMESENYKKMNDMSEFLVTESYEGTSTGTRLARYPLLFNAFFSNPLFGNFASSNIKDIAEGGHLYWMNKLTIFGLVGFIPIIYIHRTYLKTNLKYFDEEFRYYFLVSILSVVILGLMKNLTGRELWFTYFVLLPGFYYLPFLKKKQ